MSSPIAWTSTNTIFTSHPTRPQIHGQLISGAPNSKPTHRFDLSLPVPIAAAPAHFDPAFALTVSDDGMDLFAFFPPSQLSLEGGLCCIWERMNELTSWDVREFWRTERGNDVVAAQWLKNTRKWTYESDNSSTPASLIHLPLSGPRISGMTALITVMQLEEAQLHFQHPLRSSSPRTFTHIRASLRNPSHVLLEDTQQAPAPVYDVVGQRVCTHAAIAPIHNDSSVIVAIHCETLPLMGSGLLDGFAVSSDEEVPEFNDFGSSLALDVCEVQFDILALMPSLVTVPLFSVQMLEQPRVDPDAPSTSTAAATGPALRMQSLEIVATHKTRGTGGCTILACASGQDFQESTYLESWTMKRGASSPQDSPSQSWGITPQAQRSLDGASAVAVLQHPFGGESVLVVNNQFHDGDSQDVSMDTGEGHRPRTGVKRLKLVDLTDDETHPTSPLPARTTSVEEYTPRFVIPSPNQTTAAVSSGLYPPYKLSLVPTLSAHSAPSNIDPSTSPTLTYLSKLVALHIVNKTDSADIVRFFWASGYGKSEIIPLVRGALDLLGTATHQSKEARTNGNGIGVGVTTSRPTVMETWLSALLGFLLGLYSASPSPSVRRTRHTMLVLCELLACKRAFDETLGPLEGVGAVARQREGSVMWQLSVLSSWSIGLCEDIVREALRYQGTRGWESRPGKTGEEEGIAYTLLPLILLKPALTMLRRILDYVKLAEKQLQTSASKAAPHAPQISTARQLISMVESSPLQIEDTSAMFGQLEELINKDGDAAKAALEDLLIEPVVTAALGDLLLKSSSLVAAHPAIKGTDAKTRLLVPLTDLLDIPLVVRRQQDVSFAEKDIISKTPLSRVGTSAAIGFRMCVRCGSRAELRWLDRQTRVVGTSANGVYWSAFANEWEGNCVCGGNWVLTR